MSSIRLSDDWDDDGWVRVPREITRDQSLSFKAVGLVAFLASHRAGFTITREFIYASHKDGKDAVEAGLRELREFGYLTVERGRGSDGKVNSSVDYVLHRTRIREIPNVDEPASGQPATKRDQSKRETSSKKTEPIGSGDSVQPPLFEASPEVTSAVPAPSAPERDEAAELMETYRAEWSVEKYGPPINADMTERYVRTILGQFDCDPDALRAALHDAAEGGHVNPAKFYRPAVPSGARLTRMAQKVAEAIYADQNKQINFMAVRARIKTALAGGYQPIDIYYGLRLLFSDHKPPTQQLVAQYAETARTNRLASLNARGRVER